VSKAPIFVLAQAPRTGSTWVQRLLTSTGDVLIWGETSVLLYPYGDLWSYDDGENPDNPHSLKKFRKQKARMWMAVLQPFLSDVLPAYKTMLEELYEKTAKREGFPRWGVKETRWNEKVLDFLNEAWPDSEKVFVVRDFEKVFCSRFKASRVTQGRTRRADILEFCSMWTEQGELILKHQNDPHCIVVRHEDLVGRRGRQKKLCRQLELNEPDFDQCDKKISWSPHVRKIEPNWERKKPNHLDLQARDDLEIINGSPHYARMLEVSKAFGYEWLGEEG